MEKFSSLSEEERHNFFYFENFKMFLYEKLRGEVRVNVNTLELRAMTELGLGDIDELYQLHSDQWPEYLQQYCDSRNEHTTQSDLSRIKDFSQKEISAHKLFSLAIKYFRDLAVETVDMSTQGLKEEYIQWMISIPAIWSDSAKQFMRKAAEGAGIHSEHLRLVLEPEAASLFCEEHAVMASGNLDRLLVGQKYILADLGGGTADICVHEVMGEGKLRELYKATGGDFGGNTVNKEFEIFMSNIVGREVWNDFKIKHFSGYNDFMKCFETKKREFRLDTTKIICKMEPSLVSLCESRSKRTFTSIVSKCNHSSSVEYKPILGKLFLNRSEMEQFFDHSLCGIIQILNQIVQSCKTDTITTLLLVGGYAESRYLRAKIQAAFPKFRFMLPSYSRLAVLKGAVIMGYKPRDIVERRAQFTYGFNSSVVFILGEHPDKLRCIDDGEGKCLGVFNKMLVKNQVVKYGDTFTFEVFNTALDPDIKHENTYTRLWRSSHPNPSFCLDKEGSELLGLDDQACEEVGVIIKKPPPEGWPDYWENKVQLIIGETELVVKVINNESGQVYEANIDFF